MVLMGDMNGRTGNSRVARVIGKWKEGGAEGVNESGEHLVDTQE